MSFKIPSFMSAHLSALPHNEKQEAIERYKRWYAHEYTELFSQHLEDEYSKLVQEDEDTNEFLSKFQFSYVSIRNKAKRGLLKSLIKKLDYKV
tara:strand:- start:251 stop:529 length:279 start_codon:yes stop_codon:yes gene_type:complete